MSAPKTIAVTDLCIALGPFELKEAGKYRLSNGETDELVDITLGGDIWTRTRAYNLPILADQLEAFARALREYHEKLDKK